MTLLVLVPLGMKETVDIFLLLWWLSGGYNTLQLPGIKSALCSDAYTYTSMYQAAF